ncbi:MAG TPA: hypothetical protein VGW34_01085 [Allosphingosinicella sp.]|nr:hypothetical protein [Allosphingosinicella sp.]
MPIRQLCAASQPAGHGLEIARDEPGTRPIFGSHTPFRDEHQVIGRRQGDRAKVGPARDDLGDAAHVRIVQGKGQQFHHQPALAPQDALDRPAEAAQRVLRLSGI